MSLTTVLLQQAAMILQVVVAGMFALGFFLWWRRLKHWSFALLSLTFLVGVGASICGFLAVNLPRWGKTEEQTRSVKDILFLLQAGQVLQLITVVFVLVGAIGLISAALDDYLLREAYERESNKLVQPTAGRSAPSGG